MEEDIICLGIFSLVRRKSCSRIFYFLAPLPKFSGYTWNLQCQPNNKSGKAHYYKAVQTLMKRGVEVRGIFC